MSAFYAEIWGTFIFTMTILVVTGTHSGKLNKTQNNNVNAATICMALYVAVKCVGGISGGGMNPAVGFGLNVVGTVFGYKRNIAGVWVYIFGPLVGSVIAGLVNNHFH